MASIAKRGKNYRITVSAGRDRNGKQILRLLTYSPTSKTQAAIRREVEKVAVKFEEEVKTGLYLDGEHMTFDDLVERWKENYATKSLAPTTLNSYENVLALHFTPYLGRLKISKITALHLQNRINDMVEDGLSASSVRRNFEVVSSILQKAYKWGLVVENVARRCELPKCEKPEIQFWNAEQARTFLKALPLTYHFSC